MCSYTGNSKSELSRHKRQPVDEHISGRLRAAVQAGSFTTKRKFTESICFECIKGMLL